jgi:hypothetical protein
LAVLFIVAPFVLPLVRTIAGLATAGRCISASRDGAAMTVHRGASLLGEHHRSVTDDVFSPALTA